MVMRKIKLPVHSILGLHNLAAPHRLASLGPVLIVSPAHNACDTCLLKCLPDACPPGQIPLTLSISD